MQILVHAQISDKCGYFSKILKKTEKFLWKFASNTTWGILKYRFPTIPYSVANATNPSIQTGMGCWHVEKRFGLLYLIHASVSHTVMSHKCTIIPALAIRPRLAWHTQTLLWSLRCFVCLKKRHLHPMWANVVNWIDLLLPKNYHKDGSHSTTYTSRPTHVLWFDTQKRTQHSGQCVI